MIRYAEGVPRAGVVGIFHGGEPRIDGQIQTDLSFLERVELLDVRAIVAHGAFQGVGDGIGILRRQDHSGDESGENGRGHRGLVCGPPGAVLDGPEPQAENQQHGAGDTGQKGKTP